MRTIYVRVFLEAADHEDQHRGRVDELHLESFRVPNRNSSVRAAFH